jgi:hypothetical protein
VFLPEGFQRGFRLLLPVAETNNRKRKALWWGDGAKPHIQTMLRYLFPEMFGLSIAASPFYCAKTPAQAGLGRFADFGGGKGRVNPPDCGKIVNRP